MPSWPATLSDYPAAFAVDRNLAFWFRGILDARKTGAYAITVTEILEQARALTAQERKELVVKLVETLDVCDPPAAAQPAEEHWGRKVNALLDSLGPIEFVDPEITDPVEWVKAQRRKEANRLKPYWDEEK